MKHLSILTLLTLVPEFLTFFVFKVYNIYSVANSIISSIIIFTLGYLIIVIIQLFKLFWESLEVDDDSSGIQGEFPEVFELCKLELKPARNEKRFNILANSKSSL